jgi:hypothetical protein
MTISNRVPSTKRRNIPFFPKPVSKQLRTKIRLLAGLNKKNFNEDKSLQKLREFGSKITLYFRKNGTAKIKIISPRKLAIRSERQETLRELSKCLIEYCDYSLDSEHLFEIKYAPEVIAKMIGQHHVYTPTDKYPNGRSSYDCVLNAIIDLEAAGQIVVVRDFDPKTGTNKANKIFLTPLFFKEMGVVKKEMLALLKQLKKSKANGTTKAKTVNDRVAEPKQGHILHKLKKIKESFLNVLDKAPQKVKPSSTEKTGLIQKIAQLKSKIAPIFVSQAVQKVKALKLDYQKEQEAICSALEALIPT